MQFYCLNVFLALLAKPLLCNTLHDNTSAHYFAYLLQVWPPKSGSYLLIVLLSGFGGLVASMLASGIRVRGFKPGRSEKFLSMPSFGGEVKPSVPSRSFVAC
jgi:hypothetical protein